MTCEQLLQSLLAATLDNQVKLSAIYNELVKLNNTLGGS